MPSLIVPDEQTWTMLGHDPADFGAVPSFRPGATVALLLPNRIPEQLRAPMGEYLNQLSGTEQAQFRELAVPGSAATSELLERWGPAAPGNGAGVDHEDGGPARQPDEGQGSDHESAHSGRHGEAHSGPDAEDEMDDRDAGGEMHDMMAIVGEPSADGLVMETIELRYGPLAVPFPGGLTVEATLDGDVVAEASVSGMTELGAPGAGPPPVPDPLAPVAWASTIALAAGGAEPCSSVVFGVELERAVSHLAWLRSLFRLLGWRRMTRRAAAVLAELTAIDPGPGPGGEVADTAGAHLEAGASALSRLLSLLRKSRMLRWRLVGRGVVPAHRAEDLDLDGPNARASGIPRDGRIKDPLYAALGFEPLLEHGGDAAARALLRAREAAQSLELARAALVMRDDRALRTDSRSSMIEGPRGALRALRADGAWTLEAPGAAGARSLAAAAMVGEPWQDALAVLASFDLTPWDGDG